MNPNKQQTLRWGGWLVLCLLLAAATTGAYRLEAASASDSLPLTPVTVESVNSEETDMSVEGEIDGLKVKPAPPKVTAISSSWLSVRSPFQGDDNNNSYTTYAFSTTNTGPWNERCEGGITGDVEWRQCALAGLNADTDYYLRIVFHDLDGVGAPAEQVIGPFHTSATISNQTKVRAASVSIADNSLFVSVPIQGDADRDSELASVQVSTSQSGPWTTKCGTTTDNYALAPKQCRIHSLTNGTAYYVRTVVSDPDGVSGAATQILGPIIYTGRTNLAFNRPISATPYGWGCCSSPDELVDGRIQYSDWYYGFAWCGGTYGWAGCGPGWKTATIDLGSVMTVDRLDMWIHDGQSVPKTWKVEVSQDNVNFTQVFATSLSTCRTDTTEFGMMSWRIPSCGQQALFAPTAARYVRYSFDDSTLFHGIHGWAAEVEVFGP